MPKIKLSASGKVITKDGKPSCACCVTTLYVEHTVFIPGPDLGTIVHYFTMTGSVDSGFTGMLPGDNEVTLTYNLANGRWESSSYFGMGLKGYGEPDDPTGYYVGAPESKGFTMTVSLTPLP